MQLLNLLAMLLSTTLAIITHAAPTPNTASPLTADSILTLAPSTATCPSDTSTASECRTAAQAAPYIALSFRNFGISTFPVQAALLAHILLESGNLQYSRNHFPAPGRPGQGTRNMQMPEYNLAYAKWLAASCANCGVSAADVEKAEREGPDAVLRLVNGDLWGFASAAWFVSTQCGADVLEGLGRGDEAGWEAFLTGCVGTSVTEDRTDLWRRAVAMGSW